MCSPVLKKPSYQVWVSNRRHKLGIEKKIEFSLFF